MMSFIVILLIVAVVVALYVIGVFNNLNTLKARIVASIQEIGNQLKRQAELIPNLESSVKGMLKHEKDIFKMLTDARKQVTDAVTSGDIDKMSAAGDKVAQLLPQIRVAVESNPEMKGIEVVTKLMDELRDTSDKLMYARRTLIDLSADYNIQLVTFPSNLVANIFGFKSEKGLTTPMSGAHMEVSSAETVSPKINL